MRQVFIYWKVAADQAPAATAAARGWQAALRAADPALRTGLFRRSDAADDATVTLMETYARAGGVNDALRARLAAAGDAGLQPFGAPRRHVESFDALPD
jgi:hypothetical protein